MKFQCYFCNKLIRSLPSHVTHLGIHTQERPFKCRICNSKQKSYSNHSTLVQHYQNCHPRLHKTLVTKRKKSIQISEQKQPTCYFCAKAFKYPSVRDYHLATHTREYMFKCEYSPCHKRFKSQNDRQFHMDTFCPFIPQDRKSKRTQSCYFCSNNFATKLTLFYHIHLYTLEKPVKCQKCPERSVRHKSVDRNNKLVHEPDKRLQCNFCKSKAVCQIELKRHIAKYHTKERETEKCYFCLKQFNAITPKHMCLHTGEKHFCCKYCPRDFGMAVPYQINNLKQENTPELYLAQSYLSKIKNRCYFCQRPFFKPNELILHMKFHTNKSYIDANTVERLFIRNCQSLKVVLRTKSEEGSFCSFYSSD